jgi:YD repeat-containing protein
VALEFFVARGGQYVQGQGQTRFSWDERGNLIGLAGTEGSLLSVQADRKFDDAVGFGGQRRDQGAWF